MRPGLLLTAFLCVALLTYSLSGENPYLRIDQKDVGLKLPKKFGDPAYDLRANPVTPAGFLLGRELFHDTILSRDGSTSCASCHQQFAAFGHIDHALSHGIGGQIGMRNVPAIQNEIWSTSFMWDGGVTHLDLQPIAPITSPTELGESLANVIAKLSASVKYRQLFRNAFRADSITSTRMLKALSQFVALMISADSRYDRMLDGLESFTEQEQKGLQSFRTRCATCHSEPLLTDHSFRNNGIGIDTALQDLGRYTITTVSTDSLKFKVPSLRNVELTYPYMHDGRYRTLGAVLDHYSRGEFHGKNADHILQRTIGMTSNEKKDIIAFLLTLTDRSFTNDRRFSDQNTK